MPLTPRRPVPWPAPPRGLPPHRTARPADRDKAQSEADGQDREASALASQGREVLAAEQTSKLLELVSQNTQLTELTKELSQRIENLTSELHGQLCKGKE